MNYEGKRVILYARVSTEEQAKFGESIDDQIGALKCWAIANKVILVCDPLLDAGVSGHISYKKRPALMECLEYVKRKEVDVIVFTKFDRWSRSAKDYYRIQEILDANSCSWKTILEDYDTATSDGRFKVGIMLSVNQHEAERTSDRIKFTFAEKKKRGELVSGNLPKGYKIVDKKPVKDENTSAGVNAFWTAYLAGLGMNKSRQAAADHGLILAQSSATFMLRNALSYAGTIQGVSADPYISIEDAERVLATRKQKPRKTDHVYLFSGLAKCAQCGKRLGAHRAIHKPKSGTWIQVYYNCTYHYAGGSCTNTANIDERAIESQILDHLDEELDRVVVQAEESAKSGDDAFIKKRIEKLEEKKKRALEAYLDALITKEEFAETKDIIDADLSDLRKELAKRVTKKPEEIRAILPANWREVYDSLSLEFRRSFYVSIIKDISVEYNKAVSFRLNV